jgi:LAO/AO transport system kinase
VAKLVSVIGMIAAERLGLPAIERRRRRARYLIARAAAELIAERIRSGDATGLQTACDDILAGRTTAGEAAARLLGRA